MITVSPATSTAAPNASNTTISKTTPALHVISIPHIASNAPEIYVSDAMTNSTSNKTTATTAQPSCPPATPASVSTAAPNASLMSTISKTNLVSNAASSMPSAKPVQPKTNVLPALIIPPILIMGSVLVVRILMCIANTV